MKPLTPSARVAGLAMALSPALLAVAVARATETELVPPTERAALSNGAPLEVAPNANLPRDTVVVTFMGGAGKIPKDKQGVSSILFDVLAQGPEGMTQEQYKEKLFFAGGSIYFRTDFRATYLVVKAPPEKIPAMLALARDVLSRPKLDAERFAEGKAKALTARAAANDSMSFVSRYFTTRDLFGYHPETLNDTGSPRTIGALTIEDARAAKANLFDWESAFYTSTGPSRAASLKGTLEASLWPPASPERPRVWRPARFAPPPTLKGSSPTPEAVVIDKPGATDNQIYFYFPLTLKHDSPEAHDANVAHEILGGGLTGDLGRVLRVERGLTYNASSFVGSRLPVWGVYTFGGMFQTQDLLAGVLEVVDKFRTRPLTEAEVLLAKDGAKTAFQGAFELPSDMLFERIRYRLYGLDTRFLESYLQDLEKVDTARVKAFVDAKVRREGGRLYVMGDRSKVEPVLRKVGIKKIRFVKVSDIR
jgi:zinc protease